MIDLLTVVLGMILVFLVFAIVVSRLREWLAQRTCDRGAYLREGIARMINDDAISARILQHPLVNGLYRDPRERTRPPSYVDAATFALTLANVLVRRGAPPQQVNVATANAQIAAGQSAEQPLTIEALRSALANFARQNSPVASSLLPVVDRAGEDLDAALKGIERWYATGMDRVSGWYKTRARRQLFWIGFVVAALANVDAIQMFRHLNASPSTAASLADIARQIGQTGRAGDIDFKVLAQRAPTDDEWRRLMAAVQDRGLAGTLPIGYACLGALETTAARMPAGTTQPPADAKMPSGQAQPPSTATGRWRACRAELRGLLSQSPAQWFVKVLGWLLTAFAGSLGATYWFSAISKVLNIRASGPPPARPASAPAATQ